MRRVELPRPATDAAVRKYDVMVLHHAAHNVPMLDSLAEQVTNSVAERFLEDTPSLWRRECALSKQKSMN